MEDSQIVDLYWQRSDRAIAETEAKYGRCCRSIANNILHSAEDAEECVSDTWLAAWNAMPDKRPKGLLAFLARITRNFALDRWRSCSRQKRGGGEIPLALDELSECLADGTDVEREIEARELSETVGAFVRSLPETERAVFTARYFCLASVGEIAEKTGFTQSKVKSMLHCTRLRLRDTLREEGLC